MADQPDLVGTGALSLAVVALARGLEFVVTKWRASAPEPRSVSDRLNALETHVALLQAADAAHRERASQVLAWLQRLDTKLDQLMLR